jgi:hypothetical protein
MLFHCGNKVFTIFRYAHIAWHGKHAWQLGSERFEAVGAATLGRSLRAVPPLAFEGEALPALPADADERTEWVRRWLPYRWLADLAKAAQDAADLDPEAE